MDHGSKKVLARVDRADFIGRAPELERLVSHSESTANLVVLAAPRAGASELLRQTYDALFGADSDTVPFYFEIKASDRTAHDAAFRFAYQFLLQTVAFRRRDAKIIAAQPTIDELAELAVPADGYWIERLVQAIGYDRRGDPAFLQNCLSAPLRAAVNGVRSVLIIDDVHSSELLQDGASLLTRLFDFSDSSLPVVFSGHRRYLFSRLQAEIVDLEPFDFSAGGKFVADLAARHGVSINEQTRDLIAVQLGGSAGHMTSIIRSAAANADELNDFNDVERVYTDEIFGGHLGGYFDDIIDRAGERTALLRLLGENLHAALPIVYWAKHLRLSPDEFKAVMAYLHHNEIVNISSGSVSIDDSNVVLRDHIRARSRLDIDRERRAVAVGASLAEHVKRAPVLMARRYRQNAAIGLRDLLQSFDGRQVPPVLLDHARFKHELKGAGDEKIRKALQEDNDRMRLPQIVYTAHTGELYPPLNELCDIERSAVGIGFTSRANRDDIVWLAAEIESKLEAAADVTEFWCDRLEMVAAHSGFANYKIWLIAPEGFSSEAVELLTARGGYGSSRRQAQLLAAMLNTETVKQPSPSGEEYEFVVPIGGDTELLTANAVDEIAKRHKFPPKAINQIKTALVEACINAAEHSLSPDGKIRQKFIVEDGRLTITVTNRGVRLIDKPTKAVTDEGRRGWGMKLMKGLMDTVEVDQTDDGTRITMTKLLKPA